MIVTPDLQEIKRLPFGIYAIVFFLGLHIFALVLSILREQFGIINEVLSAIGDLVLEQFGYGGIFDILIEDMITISIIDIVLIVALALVIAGLLTRQRWAWVMTMIIIGISLLIGILEYFQESPRYLNMLIGVIIVFYLNERNVRRVYDPTVKGKGRTA
jgi:hypothetical protein